MNSTPIGASIEIGDSYLGITPLKLEDFPQGEYTIKITLPDYHEETRTFRLFPGSTKNIDVSLDIIKANLTITTVPYGASIYIEGKEYTAPYTIELNPNAQSYLVKVSKYGYDEYIETIESLMPGDVKILNISLVRKIGYLKLNVEPNNASIIVSNDEKSVVASSKETIETYTGRHKLTITSPWYYSQSKTINVSSNETALVNLSLVNGKEDLLKIQKLKKRGLYGAIASTGVTVILYFIANNLYNKYLDSDNAETASDFRKQTELFNTITNISGVVSAGAWGYTLHNDNSEKSLKKELSVNE